MIELKLKPRRSVGARRGHLWVFRDDVIAPSGEIPDGAEADVIDERGAFLGRGLLSANSQILCRIYSRRREPLDREFFRSRIAAAAEHRRSLGLPNAETNGYRVVFAEGDLLPGLTVDRYGDYLVLQTTTAGMELRKAMLVNLLNDLFQPCGLCERNDVAIRKQEGLPLVRGWLSGQPTDMLQIRENGIAYEVDPLGAMKTGHFFDQRTNRSWLIRSPLAPREESGIGTVASEVSTDASEIGTDAPHQDRIHHAERDGYSLCRGREVLDLFSFSGGFGLAAARAGASKVLSVDSSEGAIAAARANARLNECDHLIEHHLGDGFEVLRQLESAGRRFGVIVLDPPAFAKRKSHIDNATRGYKQINLRALRMLPVGGHLLTCSCSFQIGRDLFQQIVLDAAADARRIVRVIAVGGAGPDHPVLLNVPETDYLKSLLLTVVEEF